ncbi:MAG: hypothetical protein ACO2PM_18020 [Pyrobaculum sp.]
MELTKETRQEQIIEEIVKELNRWAEQHPQKVDGDLFYCPKCTNIGYSRRQETPKCPECGTAMSRYDEDLLRRRRKELVGNFKRVLPDLVGALVEAASICNKPLSWRVRNGRIEFELDYYLTKFTYDFVRNTVHAYFFYFDTPLHKKVAEHLTSALRRLRLGGQLVIYPPHANPPLPKEAAFRGAAYVIEL